MADSDWLTAAFEENRSHLRAVAYRLLGSMSDADDAVQDTWLRLTGADTSEVENLAGWLTTVVARVSLNMLRSRRQRHEQPVGAGRLRGPGAAGGPGHALAARAPGVRAARHVRDAVHGGGGGTRALAGGDPAAGEPGQAPCARCAEPRPRRRPGSPARG